MPKTSQNTLLSNGEAASTPILLSLKDEYFKAIADGKKKYEYRRQFRDEPCTAFIYVSSPVKAIKGVVKFDKPIIGKPKEIAKLAKQDPSAEKTGVYDYLKGSKEGYAIPVKSVEQCSNISLEDLRNSFPELQPPQLYFLLSKKPKLLEFLKENCV